MSFSNWVHALLNLVFRAPMLWLAEKTWLRLSRRRCGIDHASLERRTERVLKHVVDIREARVRAAVAKNSWKKVKRGIADMARDDNEHSAAERGEWPRDGFS